MKILIVHNKYKIRAGEDEVVDSELELLRSRGHEVFTYFKDNHSIGNEFPVWLGLQATWNREVYKEISNLVLKHQIEVMHCHNIYPQISPAVFHAAKASGAATVQTMHNYGFGCPAGQFFRKGRVCERCMGKSFAWPGVLRGCYRQSRAATGSLAVATASHRFLKTWQKNVDVYIALTEFARNKYIEAGLPANRLMVKSNFVHDTGIGTGEGNFALFVGRLNDEKGIPILLGGWDGRRAGLTLKVVGTGGLEADVRAAAASDPSIEYLGVQPLPRVFDLMGKAKALLFPSQWYEAMPRTIIESFAKGTPVIASDLGAMHSLIQHKVTGLHFPVSDKAAMIAQLEWLVANHELYRQMRVNCRRNYETNFTADKNYQLLTEAYCRAIRQSQRRHSGDPKCSTELISSTRHRSGGPDIVVANDRCAGAGTDFHSETA
jgi:glycosyltransferase involved in cell wall biosynthesis